MESIINHQSSIINPFTLTTADGLAGDIVRAIHQDADGVLWFGTWGGGVSRYDGKSKTRHALTTITTADGLVDNTVRVIHRGTDGALWFGTSGGVSRYGRKMSRQNRDSQSLSKRASDLSRQFVNFTVKDGLPSNHVWAIHGDPDGILWFGTYGGGVSRYDGSEFINFTTQHGLASNYVHAIYRGADGALWFGTLGCGVSRYDGIAWTSLDTRDGLAGNSVTSIHGDSEGGLWFGTDGGITHYQGDSTLPRARITAVTTDGRYTDLDALKPATVGTRITLEYSSIDFKTHPSKRLYRYCLLEARRGASLQNLDWSQPTRATQVDYADLPIGTYTFYVQAIDRDGNYSDPTTVNVTVQPHPRDVKLNSLQTEVDYLRREVGRKYHFENLIGRSAAIKQVQALMEKAIDSGLTVLISGETGTSKELVAKAIHYNSPRKDQLLGERNCGAISKDLIASELFGHCKGAFTGADKEKIGLFEAATGGTVLLDEIGEMPLEAQVYLLRVLQERKIQRLGENQLREVDVRVIAMTNRDLEVEVEAGRFREDLYYRLSIFPIHVPALRERLDDIPLLAEHFLQKVCRQLNNKAVAGFGPGVMEMLGSYSWPGNIRELENEIHRAAALAEEGLAIQPYHFSSKVTRREALIREVLSEPLSFTESVDCFRRRLIENALQTCNGNRNQAAKMLGIDPSNLRALIRRLGIGKRER